MQQILAHGTAVIVNSHLIVIQDYQHIHIPNASLIDGFEGHTTAYGSIANHSDVVTLCVTRQLGGLCHTQYRRDGSGGMACSKSIVFAFFHHRKTTDTMIFTIGMKLFSPACDNLMGVCLMSHIPYQFIVRSIKHIVNSHRQFHRPKAGTKMSRIGSCFGDDILP